MDTSQLVDAVGQVALVPHAGKRAAVVLSGIVHSWTERQAVVGAVRGTRGVRSVDSRLRIEA